MDDLIASRQLLTPDVCNDHWKLQLTGGEIAADIGESNPKASNPTNLHEHLSKVFEENKEKLSRENPHTQYAYLEAFQQFSRIFFLWNSNTTLTESTNIRVPGWPARSKQFVPTNIRTARQLRAHVRSTTRDPSSFEPSWVITVDEGHAIPPSTTPATLSVSVSHKRQASVQLTGVNEREFIMYRYWDVRRDGDVSRDSENNGDLDLGGYFFCYSFSYFHFWRVNFL